MHTHSEASRLVFRRQFIAGPDRIDSEVLTQECRFAHLYVRAHADVALTACANAKVELLCLGHVLDPDNPSLNNRAIVESLLARATSFAALEVQTSALGGRWLLFARIGTEARVYPDAMGLKPAFYVKNVRGGVWVASQPLLFVQHLHLDVDRDLAERFLAGRFQNSWPGEVTPYDGVRQLLPNHYLDLQLGEPRRFWPREPIESRDLGSVVNGVSSTLRRLAQAAGARRKLALPLSGGYDSRALLACSRESQQDMETFTLHSPRTELYDVDIPRRLAQRLKFKHQVLKVKPPSEEFWRLFKLNTAYLFSDPSNMMAQTFSAFADAFVLTGYGAEIFRCFYYPNGDHPTNLDGCALAKVSGFEGNSVAIASFSAWRKDVPACSGVNLLDLFYWENRVGTWCSLVTTGLDMACETIPLYNCRDLVQTALAANVRDRAKPYRLARRLCERVDSAAGYLPFNQSWRETVSELVRKHFSWRLSCAIHEARMSRAGLLGWTDRINNDVAMHEVRRVRTDVTVDRNLRRRDQARSKPAARNTELAPPV